MPGITDRCRKATFGFSLVEVLVAAALALGLILATAELVLFSLWAKQKGDIASGIASVIAARIEILKGLPSDAAELTPGVHAEVVRDGPSRRSFDVEWAVEDAAAGSSLKRIRVAAAPVGRPAARAAITIFISRDLGFAP